MGRTWAMEPGGYHDGTVTLTGARVRSMIDLAGEDSAMVAVFTLCAARSIAGTASQPASQPASRRQFRTHSATSHRRRTPLRMSLELASWN
jgi:hypothetical protein